MEPGSALQTQVFPGTKIYSINDCVVVDKVSWGQCLWKQYDISQTQGKCVDEFILSDIRSPVDCCKDGVISPKSICFNSTQGAQCLHARRLLDQLPCSTTSPCALGTCYTVHPREGTLLQLIHSSSSDKALFIGDPAHLYYTLHVSDYSSRLFYVHLPNYIETLMIYIVSLSGALAIFNAVPAFYLDGQHMLNAFLEFLIDQCGVRVRIGIVENVSFIIQLFATGLIAVNVVNAFIQVCVMYQ